METFVFATGLGAVRRPPRSSNGPQAPQVPPQQGADPADGRGQTGPHASDCHGIRPSFRARRRVGLPPRPKAPRPPFKLPVSALAVGTGSRAAAPTDMPVARTAAPHGLPSARLAAMRLAASSTLRRHPGRPGFSVTLGPAAADFSFFCFCYQNDGFWVADCKLRGIDPLTPLYRSPNNPLAPKRSVVRSCEMPNDD